MAREKGLQACPGGRGQNQQGDSVAYHQAPLSSSNLKDPDLHTVIDNDRSHF